MLKNQPFIYLFLIFILILSCSENPTSSKNTEPTASVTVDVTSGTTTTNFNFDASSSSDNEDSTSALQFRWDWENDGTWDTDYSATETATHQYSTEGDKVVKLEVKDSGGLINSTTIQLLIVSYNYETGTVTDIDGNIYQTVKIGNQWWMAENLKVIHYRNGDAVPNVTDETEWKDLSTGAYCSYDNSVTAVDTFGLLYNWHAVTDSRILAPEGWHLPSLEEWETLVDTLGGDQVAGGRMKTTGTVEAGDGLWDDPNTDATNENGFSAVPGGTRASYNDSFYYLGVLARFWSSSDQTNTVGQAYACYVMNSNSTAQIFNYFWHEGFSVRCVKD